MDSISNFAISRWNHLHCPQKTALKPKVITDTASMEQTNSI